MLPGCYPRAPSFDADHSHLVTEEFIKKADRVAAPADARHKAVSQAPFALENLKFCLPAYHRLEVAHNHRIGMRAYDRADDIKRVVDICDPVTERLIRCILQRPSPRSHG